jgi:hypothetical protein
MVLLFVLFLLCFCVCTILSLLLLHVPNSVYAPPYPGHTLLTPSSCPLDPTTVRPIPVHPPFTILPFSPSSLRPALILRAVRSTRHPFTPYSLHARLPSTIIPSASDLPPHHSVPSPANHHPRPPRPPSTILPPHHSPPPTIRPPRTRIAPAHLPTFHHIPSYSLPRAVSTLSYPSSARLVLALDPPHPLLPPCHHTPPDPCVAVPPPGSPWLSTALPPRLLFRRLPVPLAPGCETCTYPPPSL